jgi:hypothetical protein
MLTSAQKKTEAIISSVISPHATQTLKASIQNIAFCGLVTDASSNQ